MPQPGSVQKITKPNLHFGRNEDWGFTDEIRSKDYEFLNQIFGIKIQCKGICTDMKLNFDFINYCRFVFICFSEKWRERKYLLWDIRPFQFLESNCNTEAEYEERVFYSLGGKRWNVLKMVHLGIVYSVKFKIKTSFSWKWEKLYELETYMLIFIGFMALWNQHSPVGDISRVSIKQKKMFWEVTTFILCFHNIVIITYTLLFPATNPSTHWEDDMVCPGERAVTCFLTTQKL